MLPNPLASYKWSTVVDFSARGNAATYCSDGWCQPEPSLTWTDGLSARMSFLVKEPQSDVSLTLNCMPFLVDGKVNFQELHVFINFLRVGFFVVSESKAIELLIPAYIINRPELIIDFYLPRACSPASVGVASDLRVLGLAASQLVMAESGSWPKK